MNDSLHDLAAHDEAAAAAPAVLRPVRPLYWSIRRELWENRSIWIAPLAVAALVLFGSMLGTIGLPRKVRSLPSLTPDKQHSVMVAPYAMAPAPILLSAFLVGIFYCLDALHGERRDRSILFWKSLPVSDRTTVLAKAAIPLAILPAIGALLGLLAQAFLLVFSSVVLLGNHLSAVRLWSEFHFFQQPLVLLYGVAVHVLWFAPIYAWLLLVSAWAKRATFLWAVLPMLAVAAFERVAFNSTLLGTMLKYRLVGAMHEAFAGNPAGGGLIDRFSQLTPLQFLSTAGLWAGLLFAVLCLTAAVRVRRNREPI